MQFVAWLVCERPPSIGSDLGDDAEAAQQGERAPGHSCVPDVQMKSHATAARQVERPGDSRERRELGEPAACALRIDARKLAANALRQRHRPPTTLRA